jgi:hypothetical protein
MTGQTFSLSSIFVWPLDTEESAGFLPSTALERDTLDHPYPEIAESPELRIEYEIDEATFSSSPLSDLGNSPRTITRFERSMLQADQINTQ